MTVIYTRHINQVIHIGDSDGLIALLSNRDIHHTKASTIIQKITKNGEEIYFPSTTITEAITTIQVRLQNPQLAQIVATKISESSLLILPIDETILKTAVSLFDPSGSKKNTMFDATVAATAKQYGAKTIFSFDKWYKKLGLTLLVDTL